jgi:hypothetical protein
MPLFYAVKKGYAPYLPGLTIVGRNCVAWAAIIYLAHDGLEKILTDPQIFY